VDDDDDDDDDAESEDAAEPTPGVEGDEVGRVDDAERELVAAAQDDAELSADDAEEEEEEQDSVDGEDGEPVADGDSDDGDV
jgi:hypothetical protein